MSVIALSVPQIRGDPGSDSNDSGGLHEDSSSSSSSEATDSKSTSKTPPAKKQSPNPAKPVEGRKVSTIGAEEHIGPFSSDDGSDVSIIAGASWSPGMQIKDMLSSLRTDSESLKDLVQEMDAISGDKRNGKKTADDVRRLEIMNRLLELLSEQAHSNIGVLQSNIVAMFANTYHEGMPVFFYSPEEIDSGCASGPSQPLSAAMEVGVDDRLVVTIETLEGMVAKIPNFELARLLDEYTDYVQAMETAWQVATLEKAYPEMRNEARIKNASGIAVWGDYAYVADSIQHMIFRVNIVSDEIMPFCGTRNKPGFHDGPREVAKFHSPSGLAICEFSSTLYVCDTGNDVIRTVSIPSGVVHHITLAATDPDISLVTPVGICIVRGDYEYEKDGSDDEEDDDEDGDKNSQTSESWRDDEDDDDDGLGRQYPLLEGINEEDEDFYDMYDGRNRRSTTGQAWTDGGIGSAGRRSSKPSARYALAQAEPQAKPHGPGMGRLHVPRSQSTSRRISRTGGNESVMSSRRTSGYMSSHASRRTSGYMSSVSSLSSRRTSTHFSVTPGESAKDSLRECTEDDEEMGQNLAVTSDHCIFFIRPEKADIMVLAGSPTEYGYRDAEKGGDARFSSLKGITAIRNCLFVADHWNNVIRCVNLKTRQVDTVIDFNPCGPIALTVSGSGSVYVLDSEVMSVCNILKICSLQISTQDAEGALGTTMFQMIQNSIGRSRQASRRNSNNDDALLGALQRRGSARASSRRGSGDSDGSNPQSRSRRASLEVPSQQQGKRGTRHSLGPNVNSEGSIAALGPRTLRSSVGKDGKLQPGGAPVAAPAAAPPLQGGGAQVVDSFMVPQSRSASIFASQNGAYVGPDLVTRGSLNHRASNAVDEDGEDSQSVLPVVPHALRSLVPGASLHPALIQMTLRSRGSVADNSLQTGFTGSQFHVSVVSSVANDDFDDSPEFFSFLNPKHESPWKRIPIGTMQYVYKEATGQPSANSPLTLAFWDAANSEGIMGGSGPGAIRHSQQLLVGAAEWPSVIKVLPPRKAGASDAGRFRAVAVDIDRVIMADSDSNQIFVVNHTKHTKDKIAGCGKAGYLDGPLDVCRMNQPSSVALDPSTHYIYVADSGNHRIRCIDLSTGFMRTVCGNGVKGNIDSADLTLQQLDSPFDLHFMHPYYLLISCSDNSIRRLDLKKNQLDTLLVGS